MLSCDFSLIINVFKPTFDRFFFRSLLYQLKQNIISDGF